MRIDRAALPFVLLATAPAVALLWVSWPIAAAACVLPVGIALFFRDPERHPPSSADAVVAPADGRVMFAGEATPGEAPDGSWKQVTIFLSLVDVHINRAPASGRVTRVERIPGGYRAAFRHDSHRNARTEIWLDHGGTTLVFRQVVGLLARRIVCHLSTGDEVATGGRIGLMKFGSRMDVFVPTTAELLVTTGDRVRAGESLIARLHDERPGDRRG